MCVTVTHTVGARVCSQAHVIAATSEIHSSAEWKFPLRMWGSTCNQGLLTHTHARAVTLSNTSNSLRLSRSRFSTLVLVKVTILYYSFIFFVLVLNDLTKLALLHILPASLFLWPEITAEVEQLQLTEEVLLPPPPSPPLLYHNSPSCSHWDIKETEQSLWFVRSVWKVIDLLSYTQSPWVVATTVCVCVCVWQAPILSHLDNFTVVSLVELVVMDLHSWLTR